MNVEYNGISYTITQIGQFISGSAVTNVFNYESLNSITFPNTVTEICYRAFSNNYSLKKVIFPDSLLIIGGEAFYECKNLTSIELPASLTSIGISAFSGSTLRDVSMQGGQPMLEANVFNSCPIEKLFCNTIEIGDSWFSGISTLSELILGNNVQSIGNYVFSNCSSLGSVDLPSSLSSIGHYAFLGCSIESLDIPTSVVSIGNAAFANNAINTITLPKSLQSVGSAAFYGCPIQTLNVNTDADINGVFTYNELIQANFSDGATTIPSFSGASKLVDITLPSPMTSVPNNAFTDCSSLSSIILPPGIQSIGDYAFSNCVNLTEIELPDAVTKIGYSAFYGCIGLNELEIPTNVNYIGDYGFANCGSLTTMQIPEGVTSLSSELFANCTSLEKVYFSENVNSFGAYTFKNCSSLRSLIIPEGVEMIPIGMMQGCSSLTEILIPNSVVVIFEKAFQGCTSLKNIDLGTGMYTMGNYAFADCFSITDIHSMALNPPMADSYTFPTKAYTNATVTVREQSLATYNRENPWYRFQNYLTVPGAISLSHYNVDMAGNEVFQLGVYGSASEIEWSSSNPAVAYANECGLIVAMGITGATVITATVDGEEINCNVTVSSPYRDPQAYYSTRAGEDDEELQPVDVIMEGVSGNPPMVNVRLVPVGSKTIIDWTSSDPALASVQNGIVTVHADGDVDFGVETENGIEETIVVDTKGIENAGIEEILGDSDIMSPMSVYDINGRIIYFNATLEQIKSLDKGLYIIKGKRVMIK